MTSTHKDGISHAKLMAIIGLVVNFGAPGLGTIIGGEMNTGIIQLIIWAVGWFTLFILIGFLIIPVAYIWAIYSSIMQIMNTK